MDTYKSIRLVFLLMVVFVLQSFEVAAFYTTELDELTHSVPFYIGVALLIFHLPFALASFFFAVNGHTYGIRKHADFKTGAAILWTINSLFFAGLIYIRTYIYPGAVLWGVPTLCFIIGSLRWRLPIFSWLLSTFYVITVILLVLGGTQNQYGFGPKDGVHKTYYDTDKKQIQSIQVYDFGRLDGISKEYYKNGQLRIARHYHLDTLDGAVREYYENGQLKVVYSNYKNKMHGWYQYYFENGQLAMKQSFKHGILHGVLQTYYPTGALNSEFVYNEGIKNGRCAVYYEQGQLKNTCQYKQGVGNYFSYYENGQLKIKGMLNLDRRVGKWESYHSNGELESVGNYILVDPKRSAKDDLWKHYYSNGQLKLVGRYKKGVREGKWFKYFDTGEQSDARDYSL